MEAPSGGPDARTLTLAALCIEALLSLAVWVLYEPSVAGWQLRVDLPWLSDLGATISLGVDGLSLPMVVMTALVLPLAYLGSWQNVRVRTPAFGALALMLTTGLIGVFLTLDLLACKFTLFTNPSTILQISYYLCLIKLNFIYLSRYLNLVFNLSFDRIKIKFLLNFYQVFYLIFINFLFNFFV